jgi:hypothetical protein
MFSQHAEQQLGSLAQNVDLPQVAGRDRDGQSVDVTDGGSESSMLGENACPNVTHGRPHRSQRLQFVHRLHDAPPDRLRAKNRPGKTAMVAGFFQAPMARNARSA